MQGTLIGPYVLVRELGRGGMGSVHLGSHSELGSSAAVKVPHAELLRDDPTLLERFRREATVVASLKHPNIVRVHDAALQAGQPWIAMEYVDGPTLKELLATRRTLPAHEVVELLAPIADALDSIHAKDLTHRDVKPSNILLDREGDGFRPVLTDFGLVRPVTGGTLTPHGSAMGTPQYLAPEQITQGRAGASSDLYALACVAYECLTGQPPFVGTDVASVLARVGTAPPPASLRGVDARFDVVLARALEPDPASRWAWYPSASSFVAALAAVAVGPVVAVPEQRTQRLETPPLPASVVVRRSRVPAVLAAAGVLAAMAGAYMAGDRLRDTSVIPPLLAEDLLKPGVVLDAAQKALIEQGPISHVRDCEPQEPGSFVAAVSCFSTLPGADTFLLRASEPSRLAGVMESPQRPAGSCATGVGVDSTWAGGPLACYDNSGGAIATLWFGFRESGLSILALRNDGDNEALWEWFEQTPWASPAGP